LGGYRVVVVGAGRVVVGASVGELWWVVVGATVLTVVVTAGTVPGTGTVFDDLLRLPGLPDGARVVGVEEAAGASEVGEPTTVLSESVVTEISLAVDGTVRGSLSTSENVRTDTTTRAMDTAARYAIRA
jgi:hypothetical protein